MEVNVAKSWLRHLAVIGSIRPTAERGNGSGCVALLFWHTTDSHKIAFRKYMERDPNINTSVVLKERKILIQKQNNLL